jgi:hypothetical protein
LKYPRGNSNPNIGLLPVRTPGVEELFPVGLLAFRLLISNVLVIAILLLTLSVEENITETEGVKVVCLKTTEVLNAVTGELGCSESVINAIR